MKNTVSQIIRPNLIVFSVLLIVVCSMSGMAQGQAAQYKQAAAAYRDAAAKCPARQSCYFQNAAYYDCLAESLNSRSNARCTQPTCSIESPSCEGTSGTRSQDNAETDVDPINSTINNLNTVNGTLNEITNTIIGVMGNRARERAARECEANKHRQLEEQKATKDYAAMEAEAERAATRRRERTSEEETEEDERARERQRAYREQKAREKVAAKVQTSDVCGWKGLQWLGDKDTVPTLEQLRTANGGAVLSGDGAMVLKIRTITKDGIITGDINGVSVTGTLNANRQIRLAGGDKQSTYYEVWGQFSADGNVVTGKWRTEGYKVDISKPARGIFALEAECKK